MKRQAPEPPWILRCDPSATGPESLSAHLTRFGPQPEGTASFIRDLEASGLQGRGGARFPTWRKWEAVRQRARRGAVLLANGAEGDPLSSKDQALITRHPHLVIDGALLAAQSVDADEVLFYLEEDRPAPTQALDAAICERQQSVPTIQIGIVMGPARYVSSEETAAVSAANGKLARPRFTPPRPFERGVHGLPTLVQNVETLAWAALISRWGADWFRSVGTQRSPGPILLTLGGAVRRPGVLEVPHGYPLAAAIQAAGGDFQHSQGVLVGGYFGAWLTAAEAQQTTLDEASLTQVGGRLGCGAIRVLGPTECGVAVSAAMMRYLANESAQQCGPCMFGLPALADAMERLARGRSDRFDRARLEQWAQQLTPRRGACAHPDGAVALMRSALRVFHQDFERHELRHSCLIPRGPRPPQ